MKKLYLLLACFLVSLPAWADINLEPLLNKVLLQLQTQQWVTTKTALVNVNINAAVAGKGIDLLQTEIMRKLTELSDKGEWHLVSFDRQLDKSGLESMQLVAQARLPQPELANLRDKAKSISKPGETLTIDTIQFTPSDEEFQQAMISLRNNLYQQVKAEIDALNKIYPDQKYYLHQIDFISIGQPVLPVANNNMMLTKFGGGAVGSASNPAMSVGNKVQLQAAVVLAAMPDQVVQKIK